ncbi:MULTISPECIES: hypothetical protein [Tsukamurella]|uniref:Uncharacterized protein n=2 Tax=Tsukamurella TaxID=2060 RepID=A0A3P8MCY9_TSUPA|nr:MULTISPECIES: hypothetical protein [Tsukamurella]NKY18164.1 hypothetical protein [Tsukamurella spumae]UEA84019.1 hypothetical protein LK411_04055 [Tsukamurella paurometabola]VDR41180.1 Uncharacterised protein [Tsukamurella paurometabola]
MSTTTEQRKTVMQQAVRLARLIAERDLEQQVLDTVAAGLESNIAVAEGTQTPEQIETDLSTELTALFGSTGADRPGWLRRMHAEVARRHLETLDLRGQIELLDKIQWSNIGTPTTYAPARALSAPLLDDPDAGATHGPLTGTDAPDGDSAAFDGGVEVIEAELVEAVEPSPEVVGQITPSVTRYRMPEGHSYVDGRGAGFMGTLGRPRGSGTIEIVSSSEHLTDQRGR